MARAESIYNKQSKQCQNNCKIFRFTEWKLLAMCTLHVI